MRLAAAPEAHRVVPGRAVDQPAGKGQVGAQLQAAGSCPCEQAQQLCCAGACMPPCTGAEAAALQLTMAPDPEHTGARRVPGPLQLDGLLCTLQAHVLSRAREEDGAAVAAHHHRVAAKPQLAGAARVPQAQPVRRVRAPHHLPHAAVSLAQHHRAMGTGSRRVRMVCRLNGGGLEVASASFSAAGTVHTVTQPHSHTGGGQVMVHVASCGAQGACRAHQHVLIHGYGAHRAHGGAAPCSLHPRLQIPQLHRAVP